VEEEATAVVGELVIFSRKGATQNSIHAMRSGIKELCTEAALAFKKDITGADSLKPKHLGQCDSEGGTRMAAMGAHRIVFAGVPAAVC
jgi:hypothetical protein